MNDIAKQLEDQGHELRKFGKQYDTLLKYSYEVGTDQFSDPTTSAARVIGRLSRAVIEEFPGGGIVTSLPGGEKVEEKVGGLSEVVIRKIVRDKSDNIDLLVNPIDVLNSTLY